ncbi:MAG: hypothetical protein H7A45_07575 [Verrucomicrobiales bacterium]|nr:hypothetical protein [Verrucomicrobiales bacterium]
MKLIPTVATCTALLFVGVSLSQAAPPSIEVLLRDVDTEVLIGQYRHLRTRASEMEVELALERVQLRHSRTMSEEAERGMAIAEERLEVIRNLAAETRERIIRLNNRPEERERPDREARPAERESERSRTDAPEARRGALSRPMALLQGRWVGVEVGSDARAEMSVEGQLVRFRLPDRGEWYVGRLVAASRTDRDQVFAVDLKIEECVVPEYIGRMTKALVRLGEDRLTLAGNEPGREERPTGFERQGETRVFNFERLRAER